MLDSLLTADTIDEATKTTGWIDPVSCILMDKNTNLYYTFISRNNRFIVIRCALLG